MYEMATLKQLGAPDEIRAGESDSRPEKEQSKEYFNSGSVGKNIFISYMCSKYGYPSDHDIDQAVIGRTKTGEICSIKKLPAQKT
jgi:hypothetical protein